MAAYYNEIDPYAAQWLENLIDAGLIAHGYVDRRSIRDVRPGDLSGFSQCHFFAGIGGWSLAARLAEWPDDRPLWTGSCPCQPFSQAGKGKGTEDERHLWPEQHRLLDAIRPPVWMGEQVASAAGRAWLAGVQSDLERSDYASRAIVIPACSVGAPHRRERLWIVAERMGDADSLARDEGRSLGTGLNYGSYAQPRAGLAGSSGVSALGNASGARLAVRQEQPAREEQQRPPAQRAGNTFWDGAEWLECADKKRRRIKPGLALLAHGLPRDVAGMLAGFGNAIVPQVAAEVLAAYLETRP